MKPKTTTLKYLIKKMSPEAKKVYDKEVKRLKENALQRKIEIIHQYEVRGVPDYQLKRMCRAIKFSYPKLMKELRGQTGALVGNVGLTYVHDIERAIMGLANLD